MKKIAFDNARYVELQSSHIKQRIEEFGDKLYLEFGGKLFDDYHASRVLPGFEPDSKIKMLCNLAEEVEIVIVISAEDIEKNKIRKDYGITYDSDVLRLIDAYRSIGLYVGSVCITKYAGQPTANKFRHKLENQGISTFLHYPIEGYPNNITNIVSNDGFGKNDYIETSKPLVVITAPGPGSGKMATCLSQLYHEHRRGVKAGYAKFETFPIWNLPLKHPVNLAYEAATADLDDVNMIDPFHLDAYGKTTVNYNRDVEIFPVLKATFEKIMGVCPYKSPTDMGVNMAGYCICDDEAAALASKAEILRRYYHTLVDYKLTRVSENAVTKIKNIMAQAEITIDERHCVVAANQASETSNAPAFAIELNDGKLITGKTKTLLGCSSACLLNALKYLANIPDETHLISPKVIEPIQTLKIETLGNANPRLHTDEVLIALAISATFDMNASKALDCLYELKDCEAHCSVILSQVDERTYHKLGVNLTCEPEFETENLFQK